MEVSFPGCSLVRLELPAETWKLLWDLRASIQTMLHRNLNKQWDTVTDSDQDGRLLSLLVELLNNTDPSPLVECENTESEVD